MEKRENTPILYIVIPCYNEEEVLPVTAPMFKEKLESMIVNGLVADDSKILFVNDGSKDKTWEVLCNLCESNAIFIAMKLSRNRGHQNALLAGLMEAKEDADITISIDCDGQEKHLNIRAFTPKMARAAYERQKGICVKCGMHFEIEEMQADHITPWSKGGKTTAENCQMLCADCNRRKSNH